MRINEVGDAIDDFEDGDGGGGHGLWDADAGEERGVETTGALGIVHGQFAGGGDGLEGGLIFAHQLDQQLPGAGELGEGGFQFGLIGFEVLLSDTVVDGHLAHRGGERADQGGDAPPAGRGLPGGGGIEELSQRGFGAEGARLILGNSVCH
jgi:hypothetical protein